MLNSVEHFSGSLENIGFVNIEATYNDKWVLCFHKKRKKWESPGGKVESGESPLAAAKRELYEETGAINFDIVPVWDYETFHEDGSKHNNGRVYYATIREFEDLKEEYEMERVSFFDTIPENVTYNREAMIEMHKRAEKYASAFYY